MVELDLELVDVVVLVPGLLFACTWLLLSPDWLGCSMLVVLLLSVFCGLLLLQSSWLLFKTLLCTLLMAQEGICTLPNPSQGVEVPSGEALDQCKLF